MQVSFVQRQFNASDELKKLIEDKAERRFGHLLPDDSEIRVLLATEKAKTVFEVSVTTWGEIFKSQETTADLYPIIDVVFEKVERQIQKKRICSKNVGLVVEDS